MIYAEKKYFTINSIFGSKMGYFAWPTVPSTIIGTPSEYEQNRLWKNMSLLFILLVFHSKYSQKSYLFIEVKLLKEKKTVDIK